MTACHATPPAPRRAWFLLGVAILGEIGGVLGLRYSEGFSAALPTAAAFACFGVALVLVSRVMRELPVSIAYPLWAGGGTAGVAALGMALLGEPVSALRLAGVVLVNSSGEKRSGC